MTDLRAVFLTALPVETTAVIRHLTEVGEGRVRGTLFTLGQFQSGSTTWAVAVAELGAGNVAPAAIGERALAAFEPHVALLVGVAGGVKDVVIGDVVAGEKIYGYEAGKDTDHGFRPRPSAPLASYPLVQTARAVVRRNTWAARSLEKAPDYHPTAFLGAIAAGEKVVASTRSATARFLRASYGDALAVEMEGRGFMEALYVNPATHGMVIRGISDMLSGKSTADAKGSQSKAAAAAAAFAFQVLTGHADAITDEQNEHLKAQPTANARSGLSNLGQPTTSPNLLIVNTGPRMEAGWTRIQITVPINTTAEKSAAAAARAHLVTIFNAVTTETGPNGREIYYTDHIRQQIIYDMVTTFMIDLQPSIDDPALCSEIIKLSVSEAYKSAGVPQANFFIIAHPFYRVL